MPKSQVARGSERRKLLESMGLGPKQLVQATVLGSSLEALDIG